MAKFIINFVILFYFNLLCSCFPEEYLYDSNIFSSREDFYTMNINMDPFFWIVFIDTYHDYFILYDYPEGDRWPMDIIKRATYIELKENTIINNYDKEIKASVYTTKMGLKEKENSTKVINIYYTQERPKDELVFYTISDNIRQLSLGFGLSKNTTFSFIHKLYEAKIIDARKFSFEQIPETYIKLGQNSLDKLQKYKSNATVNLNTTVEHWGFQLNKIIIDKKRFYINKYAYINSAIDVGIRSSFIYKILKSFLLDNSIEGLHCNENIYNKKLTMFCSFENEIKWPNVTINIGEGNSFILPMKNLFSCGAAQCRLDFIYSNVEDVDELNNDSKLSELPIHFGHKFLTLFNLVEFDFDKPSISFYSNHITFTKDTSIQLIDIHKKHIFICLITILFISIIILFYIKNQIISKLNI
jgi:hypothetical protein